MPSQKTFRARFIIKVRRGMSSCSWQRPGRVFLPYPLSSRTALSVEVLFLRKQLPFYQEYEGPAPSIYRRGPCWVVFLSGSFNRKRLLAGAGRGSLCVVHALKPFALR